VAALMRTIFAPWGEVRTPYFCLGILPVGPSWLGKRYLFDSEQVPVQAKPRMPENTLVLLQVVAD